MEEKIVIVVDESMPIGSIANAVAVLGVGIGNSHPGIVGSSLKDATGYIHQGITTVALPILKGSRVLMKDIREKIKEFESEGITVIDLISATSTTRSYEEYSKVLKSTPIDEIEYIGLAISGSKKIVNKFTGSLGLLR